MRFVAHDARANAVRSASGVWRRSRSESIGANLGGVAARGGVHEPDRRARMDPSRWQVLATLEGGHGWRRGRRRPP